MIQAHLTSDTLAFLPKDLNVPAMQLCDLIAHPSYRSMKLESVSNRFVNVPAFAAAG